MTLPTVMSWNCRGASSKAFFRHLRDLLNTNRPDILILLETRCSSEIVVDLINKTQFSHSIVSEACGFSGGIWVLWNNDQVQLEPLAIHDQIITVLVRQSCTKLWVLSAVYASPNAYFREELWNYIIKLGPCILLPWLLIGDFNQVLSVTEKRGGCAVNARNMAKLQAAIADCSLVDLGFLGPCFTWSNMRVGAANIKERLDRGFGNHVFVSTFQNTIVIHLPRTRSDHHPILIKSTTEGSGRRFERPFRLLSAWFSHPGFEELIRRSWEPHRTAQESMLVFKQEVKHWNKYTFGNIFDRKQRCRARLGGIQRARAVGDSQYLRELETTLLTEMAQVLQQEELLWQQKSRIAWLQAGERNTRFFHASTMIRRRRNKISRLRGPNGEWCDDSSQLCMMACDFYKQLYSSEPSTDCTPSQWCFPPVNHHDRRWLNRAVTVEEVKAALFHMGAHKASGPDGFSPLFFQKFWHIVEQPILKLILGIFSSGDLPEGLNESIICLLPKCTSPDSLNQFRPISLCNVLMKVVTKVLANRLKPMMSKLTGSYQASFIPGRSTTDNITAAQEAIHSLSKRKGNNGGFILKVDLEKAYDRVEWPFLEQVLQCSGFNSNYCQLIMKCTTSASLALCWNDEKLPAFSPGRGLRQGDPLSPYLFVLCMEVLGQSISKAVENKAWRPVRLSRNGPALSHMFFADDLLLFGEASFSQARMMEHTLAQFCGYSGQRVNRNKSRLWFSANTPLYLKNSICSEFHVLPTMDLGLYLGVPLIHGRVRKLHYKYLIEKAEKKLAGWKVRFLSKASRTVLLSSAFTCLPVYSMQTASIPRSVLDHLERLSRQFFWGEDGSRRRHHTVAWDKVCQSKKSGGLGLPQLRVTNDTFLAKLLWRLIRHPTELSSNILRAKYGGWHSLIMGNSSVNSSHIWRALQRIFPLFCECISWDVANGQRVLFWLDRWLGRRPLREVCTADLSVDSLRLTVADYWCPDSGWNMAVLEQLLPVSILGELHGVSLSSGAESNDEPRWLPTASGLFSNKSASQKLMLSPPRTNIPWMRIWRFKGPTRASFMLWTCLHNALPTASLLWRCGILESPECSWCGADQQSSLHLLRDCKMAREVWKILLPEGMQLRFFSVADVVRWLCRNLTLPPNHPLLPPCWSYIFRQTIYALWINHTAGTHGAKYFLEDPYAITERSLRFVLDLLSTWNRASV